MEKNELNKNAMGGTELMEHRIRERIDPDLLDKFQIVSSRVRELDPTRKKVFWAHDLHNDPEAHQALGDERWKRFDLIVFVSHWQQQMYNAYLGVPYAAGVVIPNGIVPIEEHKKPTDKINLIYTSTPHRGLELLVPVFEHLQKFHDDIHLDVYSSFGLYGWKQRDDQFKDLFARMDNNDGITRHESVPNDDIREALKKAHIFAYPSIWPETSCLCLIEAMSAGCASVHSTLAALPETSRGHTHMYPYTEDAQEHATRFYRVLNDVIVMKRGAIYTSTSTKHLTDYYHNIDRSAALWESKLRALTSSN